MTNNGWYERKDSKPTKSEEHILWGNCQNMSLVSQWWDVGNRIKMNGMKEQIVFTNDTSAKAQHIPPNPSE